VTVEAQTDMSGLWARGGRELTDINERHATLANTWSEGSARLFAFFLLRIIVIINPKVPGSRPGRPTSSLFTGSAADGFGTSVAKFVATGS